MGARKRMISLVLFLANVLCAAHSAVDNEDESRSYLVSEGDILTYSETETWLTSIPVCYSPVLNANFPFISSAFYLFSFLTKNLIVR